MVEHKYDVALSFAGDDRGYVHAVATMLRERGIAVFYDEFCTVELWGQDLYSYLDDVYRNQSRFAVIFTSASYARNIWTSHERQSIQARALGDKGDFLLPVRLDDTDIPGLPPTLSYLNGQRYTRESVAELIIAKVGKGSSAGILPIAFAIPLTTADKRHILAVRPAGWEYLVLAGTIWEEWERLAPKRLDHELRYGAGIGRHICAGQLGESLRVSMDEISTAVSKLEGLVTAGSLEQAMGTPGDPGDAVRIEHLGRRFGTALEDILDWAARVRATACAPLHRTALELLARMADEPVRQVGTFVSDMVTAAGRIAGGASARSAEDLKITVRLVLTIAPASVEAFSREIMELGERVPRG